MEAIGGYFELADYEEGAFPHKEGILLNTGRNALEYILRSIGEVRGVYLPYYTCDVVLEPVIKLHIPWSYYKIDNRFEMVDEIHLEEGEYVIVNNYFGIKDAYIQQLAGKFGDHLIVDCSQALFAETKQGIKSFYSTRKFVGVADGGVAYIGETERSVVSVSDVECTADHDSHLIKRKQFGAEAGFADFQANEKKLDNQPIRWMSNATKRILSHINYNKVVERRRDNYQYLNEALAERNFIVLPDLDTFACPMVYPFMSRDNRDLRKELLDNKVFVAKYWPNVHNLAHYELEYEFAERVVPLPIDQRYGREEMKRIVQIIK